MLFEKKTTLIETGFTQGLIPIPKPMPISPPTPLPQPNPIAQPGQLPKPAVLPGTATVDQYYLPMQTTSVAETGQYTQVTQSGTPALGQYLPKPALAQEVAQGEQRRRVQQVLSQPTSPPTVANSQIHVPPPENFWRNTAASRPVTIPAPQDVWSGVPTTSQISVPNPVDIWKK
ncbi:hypothetical protein GF312_17265 [Candidatus Poribacteria bacterium]|nr:hypothetical protein [Candidatus Poribacteria bacterium]